MILSLIILSSVCLIEVDKLFLQQMLGTNDLYDKLNYRKYIFKEMQSFISGNSQ